jgi:DNA repair exonuclease SbcCD ATPase subunit/DNA repair exonuclease SbcCD nuclease subunit
MYKIAHCADVHIKNLKYHWEYNKIFQQMYDRLRSEEVDYIYIGGDIAHTKTQISPEFVEMCSKFLNNLAEIAPTYVILGNHDGNLRNSSRQDAITPIVEALNHPNLHLLKDAGELHVNDDLCFNVLSVFDEDNWVRPTNEDKINIAFYHGAVSGVRTDVGWVMEHGDHDVSIFEGFDYAMLGDIHKTNQILDADGRVRYAGSIVQQNHGETNDKGFLIWEIEDKTTFAVRHILLSNPKPFITIELTPKGRMPKGVAIPKSARLRLVSNNNLPLNVMKRAVDIARHRFKPESITFLNRAAGERGSINANGKGFLKENLRDVSVQEKLIREYLEGFEASSDMLKRVFDLNQKYNKIAEENEDVARNINWKLKSFEWDNLFNYGENNRLDFENLNGIVGIFGKNYSGKSSIIDGLLYTMFNTTSKNERKNLNVINQNKPHCRGKVELTVGSNVFTVERTSEKYTKRLKGAETLEAKTDLEFSRYDPITDQTRGLNGTTRLQTDANIRKNFGTVEDFLLTSMASQLDSLQFIKEGSTRRKEILAKFLDLEVFERKYKYAKDDSADLKALIRRSENRNFEEELEQAKEALGKNKTNLQERTAICDELKSATDTKTLELEGVNERIDSIPENIIDILDTRQEKEQLLSSIATASRHKEECRIKISETKETLLELETFLGDFDIEDLNARQNEVDEKSRNLEETIRAAKHLQRDYNSKSTKLQLLDVVPCGDQFPKCRFIKDAHSVKEEVPLLQIEILEKIAGAKELKEYIASLDPDQITHHINKYTQALDSYSSLGGFLKDTQLLYERSNTSILETTNILNTLETDIATYEDNKGAIENFECLLRLRQTTQDEIVQLKEQCETCNNIVLELYKNTGSLEQQLAMIKSQKKDYQNIQQEYAAYDLYLQCMHSNGIAYDIIKKQLPIINEEVAKVLANIVSFEVFFEDDGRRLNIFIKHPKHEPRPLGMGSGAEKTIASMAIRLALLSVSSLPKGDIFILDEPGTSLDADNMEGFIRILDLIKTYFKTVVLISHLDSLKDCVDTQIVIETRDNYANVEL